MITKQHDIQAGSKTSHFCQPDVSTGQVEITYLGDSQIDDLLDDLGKLVVKMGGVIVIPADQMPVRTGLAATYRY